MSKKLEQARGYEKAEEKKIPQELRPVFHVTPPVGWCNDPNGFSAFQGEYHLFFQYHPYSTKWGPMHWGHCKSKDFIRWERLPCALAPDMSYDCEGCFSGSGIAWKGKHYLMYTSVNHVPGENGREEVRQTQSIAVGDGVNYEKLPCNPVITAAALPQGSSLEDFRDPKIWREGDCFYAVVGSRSEDGSGQLPVFSSRDMEHWELVRILDRSRNEYGKMWECPDFFELGGKGVILTSPQEMETEGFPKGNGSLCLIGAYDRQSHAFIRESAAPIDYGTDFYAPQTMDTEDGRRIMIAWMNSWENNIAPADFPWAGFMTVPRELSVREGKLFQSPVQEISKYYTITYSFDGVQSRELRELSGVSGRVFDMTVELDRKTCGRLELLLAAGKKYETKLLYDGERNLLSIDRTHSGASLDSLPVRAMEMPEGDRQTIRILMDRYTVEVFAGGGEKAMTSLVYTPLEAEKIMFLSDGPVDILYHKIGVPQE